MSLTTSEKLQVIGDTWNLESTGIVPYTIEIGQPHFATNEFFEDDAAELAWHEAYHDQRHEVIDFDMPNIKPNLGIGTIAAAFGCKLRVNNEGDPWTDTLINAQCRENVYDLQPPDLESNPIFNRVRDRLGYLQNHGSMPLRLVNVASPMLTASMIWDYTDFMLSLLTSPKEVHHLLDIITQATIDYVNLQLDTINDLHSMGHEVLCVPQEVGLRVSDDTAALLSPDLYREFGVTYNAKLADAFGGVVVHSCGDCSRVVSAMLETPGLKGLDLTMPQNTDWSTLESAAGEVVLSLRHYFWDHGEQFVDPVEYTRRLINSFGTTGIFIVTSMPDAGQARDLGKKLWAMLGEV